MDTWVRKTTQPIQGELAVNSHRGEPAIIVLESNISVDPEIPGRVANRVQNILL